MTRCCVLLVLVLSGCTKIESALPDAEAVEVLCAVGCETADDVSAVECTDVCIGVLSARGVDTSACAGACAGITAVAADPTACRQTCVYAVEAAEKAAPDT